VVTVIKGNTQGLVDADEFIKLVNDPPAALHDLFEHGQDIFVTRAPGRLDVMGGIADYSGSLVLEMPIAEATFAAIQTSSDDRIRIASLLPRSTRSLKFEMNLADLASIDKTHFYDEARKFFLRNAPGRWAGYAAGAFFVLRHELGVEFRNGARILISSCVPVGKGVSSSAALEVATMHAICRAYDLSVDPRQIALLCQKVENYVVGAPCGVMDQITASCGVENSLLSLLCQPAEIQGTIGIPDEIEFWGIDSGVRHSVAGADYSSVRAGAFMGYRIIAHKAGFSWEKLREGLVKVDDDLWVGCLSNISPDEYQRDFATMIPDTITGDEFLGKFGGVTDRVSIIDRSVKYRVKAATEHAIYESERVRTFAELLSENVNDETLKTLGNLMYKCHESYAACGLTEPRTDRIVDLVRQDTSGDLFGARITGGGSGGTVAILARRNSHAAIANIAGKIANETGHEPYVFHGSSPGASRFGHIRLGSVGRAQLKTG
jgi:L-arabinokinase